MARSSNCLVIAPLIALAMLSLSSTAPYMPDIPMQPRAMRNTFSPVEPSSRVSG